jgi:hypothetical protein
MNIYNEGFDDDTRSHTIDLNTININTLAIKNVGLESNKTDDDEGKIVEVSSLSIDHIHLLDMNTSLIVASYLIIIYYFLLICRILPIIGRGERYSLWRKINNRQNILKPDDDSLETGLLV